MRFFIMTKATFSQLIAHSFFAFLIAGEDATVVIVEDLFGFLYFTNVFLAIIKRKFGMKLFFIAKLKKRGTYKKVSFNFDLLMLSA